jgi:sigma-E factor negative regulatory protein RseA
MTDRIKEQLSTFLDGELPDAETALLLKRLERDDDLRGALSRYSLIGAVLRNDGDVPAARQVAARVSAAIAREPAQHGNGISLPGRAALLRSGAGLAIAAGVAAAALLLVQQAPLQGGAAPEAQVAQIAESPIIPVSPVDEDVLDLGDPYVTPPAIDGPGSIPPANFANYLVAHYGYASPLVRRSVSAGLISANGEVAATEPAAVDARTGQ